MDSDTRWQDAPPSEEGLVGELVAHLKGEEPQVCPYCWEEMDVRQQGIEGVNLYEDFMRKEAPEYL